jgi:ATP-dependent DNA helicase RecG
VLPFHLTTGQKIALKEIVDDLQKDQPMTRLLQGDVGAGKTIVALIAAVVAMENGLQAAFMAPTEILAEQHFVNISRLLQASRFRVALLTGSTGSAARREQLAQVESGAIQLVVVPHALVQGDVSSSSGWSSSTSSIASACCSARRSAPKGCTPTCW